MEFVFVLFRVAKVVMMKTNQIILLLFSLQRRNGLRTDRLGQHKGSYLNLKKISLMGLHGALLVMTHGET